MFDKDFKDAASEAAEVLNYEQVCEFIHQLGFLTDS